MNIRRATRTGAKMGYTRWLYGRALIDRLRDEGHSWTTISGMVKGHGDSPGWAAEAYKHRHIFGERDIVALEQLVAELRGSGGTKEGGNKMKDRRLKEGEKDRYLGILEDLKDKYGWTTGEIAESLGYSSDGAVYGAKRSGGSGMLSKLVLAEEIVEGIEKEKKLFEEERLRVAERASTGGGSGDDEELRKSVVKSSEIIIKMMEEAPPYKKRGLEEALVKVSDLMEFLGY